MTAKHALKKLDACLTDLENRGFREPIACEYSAVSEDALRIHVDEGDFLRLFYPGGPQYKRRTVSDRYHYEGKYMGVLLVAVGSSHEAETFGTPAAAEVPA